MIRWHFFAPEVGFEHYYGSLNTNNELHPIDLNARPPGKLESRFSSNAISFAPKLIFGNEEAALVLIPQYNVGALNARGNLLRDTGRHYFLSEQQKESRPISLLLKYNLLNTKILLKDLEFSKSSLLSSVGSAQGLGLGFRVYFDLLKLF